MPPFRVGLVKRDAPTSDDDEREESEQDTSDNETSSPLPEHKTDSVSALQDALRPEVRTAPVEDRDEYSSEDTSDEEGGVGTAGSVPRWWYDEYNHVDYDTMGRRVLRPAGARRDRLDEFLRRCEEPDFWRTVQDPNTKQDIVLSVDDLKLISRLRSRLTPGEQEEAPWVEWFTHEVMQTPIRAFPEHKRSFLPSRDEQKAIGRIVHALRMGWAKTRAQLAAERRARRQRPLYDLWAPTAAGEEAPRRAAPRALPAPKRSLPHHAESYNPPPEYLLDDKEMKEWNKLSSTPWKRKYTFLPTRHSSLRAVPAFPRYTRERFLRCLDLYLAPRALKMRLTIGPEALVPQLPSPRDLQPFPTSEALCLRGHSGLVRSCDFDPSGQYIVSGGSDGTLRVWETSTGRCLKTIELGEEVVQVSWTPASGLSLVAAAVGSRLLLINPGADIGAHRVATRTDELLLEPPPQHDAVEARTAAVTSWPTVDEVQWARGVRVLVTHHRPLVSLCWHAKGDYVAVTVREASARAVLVHQLSRRRSQLPLKRARGLVQTAVFHPQRPQLLVATQRVVRVYDLLKQQLVRKLETGAQWISSLAVHPGGDHVLVTSYDRKAVWFDLELSSRPYQTLRLHGGAVRSVAFHARYPLFATGGDDSKVVVSHGMVYHDLLQNPLLVPLKALRGPTRCDALCVTELRWHPAQPWLLAAGADATLRLYT